MEPVDLLLIVLGVAVVVALLIGFVILSKGRRRPGDHVFRASRLSRGNRIFPTQVSVSPTSITMYHPQFVGKIEESIHIAHIASIKIDTNLMFSDVVIETTGGQNPVVCHGHTKGDAVEMKRVIEEYQSKYYGTRQKDQP